ncbi:MAG: hypothetical protein AAFR59_02035 [Bacteroidota bacterium]
MADTHFNPESLRERFVMPARIRNISFGLIGIGLVFLVMGYFLADGNTEASHHEGEHTTEEHAALTTPDVSNIHQIADEDLLDEAHGDHHHEPGMPLHEIGLKQRVLGNFLLCGMYFFLFGTGAFFFLIIHKIGNAGWHVALHRIAEAVTMYLPIGAIVFAVLLFFLPDLYDWAYVEATGTPDKLIELKAGWLNTAFFIGRTVVFVGAWILVAMLIRRWSIAQDDDPSNALSYFKKQGVAASIGLVFFAVSFCLFTVDWIKSLEPHWFSTIFGVLQFGRSMVSTMVVLYFITAYLKSLGYLKAVSNSHFHDIGGYTFGFTIFWSYIWLAQYLLIWYSNIPEEGFYYVKRYRVEDSMYLGGNFNFFFYGNIILNFLVPFLALVAPIVKRNIRYYLPVGILLLYGHWHDLYQQIMPGAVGRSWDIGLLELGMWMTFAGIFIFTVFTSLTKANLFALNHPYMEESAHHNTGEIYREFDVAEA